MMSIGTAFCIHAFDKSCTASAAGSDCNNSVLPAPMLPTEAMMGLAERPEAFPV